MPSIVSMGAIKTDSADTNNVYIKLRRLREEKGLSRKSFCQDFNSWSKVNGFGALPKLLERTYKSWETGEHDPNTDYLTAFCRFYQVDMSYFFDDRRIVKKKVVEDVSKYIGLDEECIIALHNLAEDDDSYSKNMLQVVQSLISSPCGRDLLFDIVNLRLTAASVLSLMESKEKQDSNAALFEWENLHSWEVQCKYAALTVQTRLSNFLDEETGISEALEKLNDCM